MPNLFLKSEHTNQIYRLGQSEYAAGLRIVYKTPNNQFFLSCCGLAGLENFDCAGNQTSRNAPFAEKAEYLACLFRALYHKGTVIYTLTTAQVENNFLHQWLVELGAIEITQFRNLYWGTATIHVFLFKVRNIAGRYCNQAGEPYASESAVNPADRFPDSSV